MSQLTTSKVLASLVYGEFSSLKLGDLNNGLIRYENLTQVLEQLNRALKDIFTRFLLSTKEVIINTDVSITHYYLRYEYAFSNSNSNQNILYIDDALCENFSAGIAKILTVYDSFGREVFMNKTQEPLSVFTPQFDCLQIPANHEAVSFYVLFQALHPEVTYDPDSVINIPPSLVEPLLFLTASKIFENIGGASNAAKSAIFHQKFEMALLQAEIRDSSSTSENMSNSKLEQSGFR